jgi:hypothetical protein
MSKLPKWIGERNNREILAFVGGGIAAVVVAGWAVYQYVNKDNGTIEATYNVCQGMTDGCPANTVILACGQSIAEWAKKECGSYTANQLSSKSGGGCGQKVVQIKCTAHD